VQLIKKALIKQVLTKKSKAILQNDFKQEKVQLERECEQLLFEERKLHHQLGVAKQDIKERFQREIEMRKEKINTIDFKMEQLAILDLGSEMIEKEVDTIVNVEIGSQWSELNDTTSIVIKDDIVIRIDND